jgi:hypothetical protein
VAWLHLFLVLSLAVSAFTTASNYQNSPAVSGDAFRMPTGGGAVSNKQLPRAFALSSVQAHAPDVEMQQVEAVENVRKLSSRSHARE